MGKNTSKKDWKYITLVISSYITMFFFGVIENVKGVTFVLIKDIFHASYDAQGYLVSVSWYGYVIFCLVCAFVIDRYGIRTAIICGHALCLLGCIITPFMNHFIPVIIALMVVWMGFGFFEVGYNAFATVLFTENSAIYLNLMHSCYAFGAIAGPLIASWLVTLLNDSYKGVYKALAVAMFIMLIVTLIIPFSPLKERQTKNSNATDNSASSHLTVWKVFCIPETWLCAFTLGFMEVIEFGASNWGALYYRDVYGLSVTKEGALFVSMFYILFALARVTSGWFIEKLGYYTSLFASLVIVVIIYLVGFLCGVNGRWIIPFTGFFIAIMFPTFMCVLMKIFGDDTSIISSVVIFLSGATNGLIQLIIGYINEYLGNEWGFRCNVLYTIIPFVLLLFVRKNREKYLQRTAQKGSVEMKTITSQSADTVTVNVGVPGEEVKVMEKVKPAEGVKVMEEVKPAEGVKATEEVKTTEENTVKTETVESTAPNQLCHVCYLHTDNPH